MANVSPMSLLPNIQARNSITLEEKVIVSRAGRPVDISGMVWKLPDPTKPLNLDWNDVLIPSTSVMAATRAYMKHLVRNYSTGSTGGAWYALLKVWTSSAFQVACTAGEEIPIGQSARQRLRSRRISVISCLGFAIGLTGVVIRDSRTFPRRLLFSSMNSLLEAAPRVRQSSQPILRKDPWSILRSLRSTTLFGHPD